MINCRDMLKENAMTTWVPEAIARRYPLPIRSPAQLYECESIEVDDVLRIQALVGGATVNRSLPPPPPPPAATAAVPTHQPTVSMDILRPVAAAAPRVAPKATPVTNPSADPVALGSLTCRELRLLCAENTLQRDGGKAELVERLAQFAKRQPKVAERVQRLRRSDGGRVDYRTFLQSAKKASAQLRRVDVTIQCDSRERATEGHSWEEHLSKAGHPQGQLKKVTLPIGDFMFTGRLREDDIDALLATGPTGEVVLDAIVERKKWADLASSVIDSRYQQQKRVLKKCGIPSVFYVIEGTPQRSLNDAAQRQRCESAALTTMLVDKLHVVWSLNALDTSKSLCSMARVLSKKTPRSSAVSPEQWSEGITRQRQQEEISTLLPRMLAVIRGCSYDVAIAVASEIGSLKADRIEAVLAAVERGSASCCVGKSKRDVNAMKSVLQLLSTLVRSPHYI